MLVSNDRLMIRNSRKAGIEAYYLLEEYEAALNRLKELKTKDSVKTMHI